MLNSQANNTESAKVSSLADLQFLLGQWEAISQPGEPTGGFSFESHLLAHIILRTNHADYPATDEKPAFRHEDLMVIYLDERQNLQADYYDSEAHVIRYTAQVGTVNEVTFISSPVPTEPRFRLTYRLIAKENLTGTFEIALPHQPDIFSPYLTWSARRIK